LRDIAHIVFDLYPSSELIITSNRAEFDTGSNKAKHLAIYKSEYLAMHDIYTVRVHEPPALCLLHTPIQAIAEPVSSRMQEKSGSRSRSNTVIPTPLGPIGLAHVAMTQESKEGHALSKSWMIVHDSQQSSPPPSATTTAARTVFRELLFQGLSEPARARLTASKPFVFRVPICSNFLKARDLVSNPSFRPLLVRPWFRLWKARWIKCHVSSLHTNSHHHISF
jgi:hypothetical protein